MVYAMKHAVIQNWAEVEETKQMKHVINCYNAACLLCYLFSHNVVDHQRARNKRVNEGGVDNLCNLH